MVLVIWATSAEARKFRMASHIWSLNWVCWGLSPCVSHLPGGKGEPGSRPSACPPLGVLWVWTDTALAWNKFPFVLPNSLLSSLQKYCKGFSLLRAVLLEGTVEGFEHAELAEQPGRLLSPLQRVHPNVTHSLSQIASQGRKLSELRNARIRPGWGGRESSREGRI